MPALRPTTFSKKRNVTLKINTSIASDEVADVVIEGTDEERGRSLQRTSNTGRNGIRTAARTPKSAALNKTFAPFRNPNRSRSPAKRPAAISPLSPRSDEKKKKKFFLEFDEPDRSPAYDAASNLQDLHEIVPGLFIAIGIVNFDDKFEYVVPQYDDYTHLVRIGYDEDRHTWSEEDDMHKVLNLAVERPPPRPLVRLTKTGRRVRNTGTDAPRKRKVITDLGSRQLRKARDFLGLALPYYAEGHRPPSPLRQTASPSKVLIIAPAHVDAMSIVVAYLAFCSGVHPFRVIKYIDIGEDVPDAWRNIFPVIREPSPDDPETYYGEGAERIDWISGDV